MQSLHRTLIGLALASALASPLAMAQANTRANDAVSNKATAKETSAAKVATAVSAGAQAKETSSKPAGAATSAAGQGNWWKSADSNGDGKLSATEATANAGLSSRFNTIDGNKDGFVTDEEYRKFFAAASSHDDTHPAAKPAGFTPDVWVKLDSNADSKISLAEAKANADLTGSFTAVDADGDGFITKAEYSAYAQQQK